MTAMLGMRAFALAADRVSDGVYCGPDGVFVGDIPLLKHSAWAGGWSVRPTAELNDELTACYRLPVDIAVKADALALIAHALNRADLAMAAIATVQMHLPDPPALSKSVETTEEILQRAADLHRNGLLKYGDWNPEKHPRTGAPPNPGWFAPLEGGAQRPWRIAAGEFPDEEEERRHGPLEPTGGTGSQPYHHGDEIRPLQIVPGGLPFLPRPARPEPEPPSPAAPRSTAPRPPEPQPRLPFPGGLPPQRAPSTDGESDSAEASARGGRLGNAATRAQNAEIATELEKKGFTIIYGGGIHPEEYIPGEGPGTQGGTFVDITAINKETGVTLRVQTVDTLADGETPTPREAAAAARIRSKFANDSLWLLPKRAAQ